ncbi:MAG TPA: TIR domain-containing protein, partial [Chitinophagaceae bacterium]|nr:TIR domain-containing protein [Chitinophagaceae bacterium]
MQFSKDIFISYAHIDDESLIASQRGWISEFHRALEIRLAQLLGRRPNIWRDMSLQGNHIFDQQIVSQFANVAIMISILTPRYVKSDWCIREVNEFYNACEQNIGFNIQNIARIFKVIKTPIKIESHPEK